MSKLALIALSALVAASGISIDQVRSDDDIESWQYDLEHADAEFPHLDEHWYLFFYERPEMSPDETYNHMKLYHHELKIPKLEQLMELRKWNPSHCCGAPFTAISPQLVDQPEPRSSNYGPQSVVKYLQDVEMKRVEKCKKYFDFKEEGDKIEFQCYPKNKCYLLLKRNPDITPDETYELLDHYKAYNYNIKDVVRFRSWKPSYCKINPISPYFEKYYGGIKPSGHEKILEDEVRIVYNTIPFRKYVEDADKRRVEECKKFYEFRILAGDFIFDVDKDWYDVFYRKKDLTPDDTYRLLKLYQKDTDSSLKVLTELRDWKPEHCRPEIKPFNQIPALVLGENSKVDIKSISVANYLEDAEERRKANCEKYRQKQESVLQQLLDEKSASKLSAERLLKRLNFTRDMEPIIDEILNLDHSTDCDDIERFEKPMTIRGKQLVAANEFVENQLVKLRESCLNENFKERAATLDKKITDQLEKMMQEVFQFFTGTTAEPKLVSERVSKQLDKDGNDLLSKMYKPSILMDKKSKAARNLRGEKSKAACAELINKFEEARSMPTHGVKIATPKETFKWLQALNVCVYVVLDNK